MTKIILKSGEIVYTNQSVTAITTNMKPAVEGHSITFTGDNGDRNAMIMSSEIAAVLKTYDHSNSEDKFSAVIGGFVNAAKRQIAKIFKR